jgi:hypothetical protein
VGNGADTTEDTLQTYTLPAAAMSTNGQGVRITAWGTGVNTAEATTVKLYFGSTAVVSQVLTVGQANTWRITAEVLRSGAATQVASGQVLVGGTVSSAICQAAAPTETLSGAVVIKCTGQRGTSSTANSVVQTGMIVEMFS